MDEIKTFEKEGVICHTFHEILLFLSKRVKGGLSGSAGGDLAEIVSYYEEEARLGNGRKPGDKARRNMPPVSTATSGLMPGIDLNNLAELQSQEDEEYLARTK
jgi:hypothetical protein